MSNKAGEFTITDHIAAATDGAVAASATAISGAHWSAVVSAGFMGAGATYFKGGLPSAKLPKDPVLLADAVTSVAAARTLAPHADAIRERLEDLSSTHDPGDVATSYLAVARQIRVIWERTTEEKKRKLLMAGLVNAFDREVYESGITQDLIRLSDTLGYGELMVVRMVHDREWYRVLTEFGDAEDEGPLAWGFERETHDAHIRGSLGSFWFLETSSGDYALDPQHRDEAVVFLLQARGMMSRVSRSVLFGRMGKSTPTPLWEDAEWAKRETGRLTQGSMCERHISSAVSSGVLSWGNGERFKVPSGNSLSPLDLRQNLRCTSVGRRMVRFLRDPSPSEQRA